MRVSTLCVIIGAFALIGLAAAGAGGGGGNNASNKITLTWSEDEVLSCSNSQCNKPASLQSIYGGEGNIKALENNVTGEIIPMTTTGACVTVAQWGISDYLQSCWQFYKFTNAYTFSNGFNVDSGSSFTIHGDYRVLPAGKVQINTFTYTGGSGSFKDVKSGTVTYSTAQEPIYAARAILEF
jgi:hypothetical protein